MKSANEVMNNFMNNIDKLCMQDAKQRSNLNTSISEKMKNVIKKNGNQFQNDILNFSMQYSK